VSHSVDDVITGTYPIFPDPNVCQALSRFPTRLSHFLATTARLRRLPLIEMARQTSSRGIGESDHHFGGRAKLLTPYPARMPSHFVSGHALQRLP
jgi:hypothetical protein